MKMVMTGDIRLFLLVLWPLVAAFSGYLIGRRTKRGRDYFANIATCLELCMMLSLALQYGNENILYFNLEAFMGARISLMLDGFRAIYGTIAAFMWFMTTLFSREYFAHYRNRNRYYMFMLLTLTGTIGVFLSADLLTTFMFFEMMSFTSYVMVIHDEKPGAQEAAKTYMAVAVIGGLAMLFGIFLISHELHTTNINELYHAMHHFEGNKAIIYLACAFMLVGFGGKAGMYPIHIWLPNAHPAAPAPASALLSGVLTKTGIYGILIMSCLMFAHDPNWGMVILIIGTLGMFTGAMLAVFSIDLKRTLACSSVSQIGFILVGVGMQGILGHHGALAVRGTMLHMVNHSLIKLLLFMAAGAVYMNLHALDLNQVRGFGRKKPLLAFCFLMGVLAIIGMPFWNGYVSKTLLHESIVEKVWLFPDYTAGARFFQVIECIFTFSGGMTASYMTKLFICLFIEKNQFNQAKMDALCGRYMNKTSSAVLFICAIIMPILGFRPYKFMIPMSKIGQVFMLGEDPAHAVEFFAWANVKGAVASLCIGAILYIFVIRGCLMKKDEQGRSMYINVWPKFIDIEQKVYRPLLLRVLPFLGAMVTRIIGTIPGKLAHWGFVLFNKLRMFWRSDKFIALNQKPMQSVADARTFWHGPKMQAVMAGPMNAVASGRSRFDNENHLINTEKMHAWFDGVQDNWTNAENPIWDGLQDFVQGTKTFVDTTSAPYKEKRAAKMAELAALAAAHDDGHGHDEHGHDSHGHDSHGHDEHGHASEHAKEKKAFTIKGMYQGLVEGLRKLLRVPDDMSIIKEKKEMSAKDRILATLFNSLEYGLFMFLVGVVIVLIVVFVKM